jgi:hypothetical protein
MKTFFQKFSDSAEDFLTKSKIFYQKNIKRERKMCFCNADLKKYQSCSKAKDWLSINYSKD